MADVEIGQPFAIGEVRAVLQRAVGVGARAFVRVAVGRLRQRVRARELQPLRQTAVRRDPQTLVVRPAQARALGDVAESRARQNRARRREPRVRAHGAAGRRELVQVDRNPLAIAVRSEVPDHQARSAELALDVHVPRLHASRQEVQVGERRRHARRAGRSADRVVELDVARGGSGRLRRQRRDERRIAGLAGEVAGVALVDQDGVRAADDKLAVAGGIPDEADARLEVAAVLGNRAESSRADLQQRQSRRVEGDELVVRFRRRGQEVVAQPKVGLQVRAERDAVLDESADGVHVGVVRTLPEHDVELAREAGLERGDARIGHAARIRVEIEVLHASNLAAELHDMVAVEVGRCVADGERGHLAAAREPARPPEAQPGTRNSYVWQRDRHGRLTDVDPERAGVHQRVRNERDADAVVPGAYLVDERRTENVSLIDRQDLPVAAARVAETGDGLALGVRLDTTIGLERVIDVQVVALPEIVAGVDRVLVDLDRRQRRADRSCACQIVRRRDVCEQSPCGWIGDTRALRVGQRSGIEVDALLVTKSFIAAEVERPVLHHRSTEVHAELLAIEERLRCHVATGIDARRVEGFAVHRVGPRPGGDVDDRAGIPAVLRAEGRVVDLELGHRVDRRLEGDLRVRQVVQVDAVHHEVDGRLPVARRHEGERSLAAQRRAQPRVLRRRAATGHQRPEVDEMPAVQRNFLNRLLGHDLPNRDGGRLDERRRAGHGDVFRDGADTQLQIEGDGLGGPDRDLALLVREPFEMRGDLVGAGRERRRHELAGGIGHDVTLLIGRGLAQHNRHAGHDGALRIGDGSLDRGRGLRAHRRDGRKHGANDEGRKRKAVCECSPHQTSLPSTS